MLSKLSSILHRRKAVFTLMYLLSLRSANMYVDSTRATLAKSLEAMLVEVVNVIETEEERKVSSI